MFTMWWKRIWGTMSNWRFSSKRGGRREGKGRLSTYRIWFEPLEERLAPANTILEWTGGAGASAPQWSNSANWVKVGGTGADTYPNATTDIAQFTSSTSTNVTATVNGAFAVGGIDFSGSRNYTINNADGGTLALQAPPAPTPR